MSVNYLINLLAAQCPQRISISNDLLLIYVSTHKACRIEIQPIHLQYNVCCNSKSTRMALDVKASTNYPFKYVAERFHKTTYILY